MSGKSEKLRRQGLSDYEQMADAQGLCVPCKLCGGAAKITDAGTGAGYYVSCSNSTTWRDSTGCLINERRLGGWAYNVADWWNRLHASPTPPIPMIAEAGEREVQGSLACPICGEDKPHHHTAPIVNAYQTKGSRK